MILGVGTDIVQVDRFNSWKKYSKDQLARVFSEQELKFGILRDAAAQPSGRTGIVEYNLEFLASRFAAKEAFYKALSQTLVNLKLTKNTFPFLFVCKYVEVIKPVWGVPELKVDWKVFEEKIGNKLPKLSTLISLSHEKSHVVAFVVISN